MSYFWILSSTYLLVGDNSAGNQKLHFLEGGIKGEGVVLFDILYLCCTYCTCSLYVQKEYVSVRPF